MADQTQNTQETTLQDAWREYAKGVLRHCADYNREDHGYAIIGLMGEAGELFELLKKRHWNNAPIPDGRILEECGDVLWYVALMETHAGAFDMPDFLNGETPWVKHDDTAKSEVWWSALQVLGCMHATRGLHSDEMRSRATSSLTRMVYAIARILELHGYTLRDAMSQNAKKLQERHGNGYNQAHYTPETDPEGGAEMTETTLGNTFLIGGGSRSEWTQTEGVWSCTLRSRSVRSCDVHVWMVSGQWLSTLTVNTGMREHMCTGSASSPMQAISGAIDGASEYLFTPEYDGLHQWVSSTDFREILRSVHEYHERKNDKSRGAFYADTGTRIGELVQRKNEAYGDSFTRCQEVMRSLYPEGITVEQYANALAIVRVVDKLFRIATASPKCDENPWEDIADYGILMATAKEEQTRELPF